MRLSLRYKNQLRTLWRTRFISIIFFDLLKIMATIAQNAKPVVLAQKSLRPAGVVQPNGLKKVNGCHVKASSPFTGSMAIKAPMRSRLAQNRVVNVQAADDKVVVIGLAADSGCGKSTFMRRVTGIFGGVPKPPSGGNPDSNTLISDMTTVICLDDYHCLDRNGRKEAKVTALAPEAQNFDLMYDQVGILRH